jgi:ribosomal protein S18 acetylase RimI-like enzyme
VSCGKALLDRYLREQAMQDAKRRLAATVVAVPRGSMVVAGYYSLSAASVDLGELQPHVTAKLPRYPRVPATLLARLARDRAHAGRGVGEYLLVHALSRSLTLSREIASMVVVVDAVDDEAAAFYRSYEFLPLRGQPLRLYLPTASIVNHLS